MIQHQKQVVQYARRFGLTIKGTETPLVLAIRQNDLAAVKKLLQSASASATLARQTVNTVNAHKIHEVPLLLAIEHGSEEMVQVLVKAGANPEVSVNSTKNPAWLHEKSALTLALEQGYSPAVIATLLAGVDVKTLGPRTAVHNPMSTAVFRGDYKNADAMLKAGVNINERDIYGRTMLLKATLLNKPDAVDYLLKNSANPNLAFKAEAVTPLMAASARGSEQMVAALLGQKAKLHVTDKDGRRALNYARAGKHIKAAELIIAAQQAQQ